MKYISYITILFAATVIAFADDSTGDATAIQGKWAIVKAEVGGRPLPEEVAKTISLKLNDGRYEVIADGNPDRGTYTIDAATSPKSITVVGTEGPNQGKTYPAIYELKGDLLRICYDLSGAARPTEFKSTKGTKLYLVLYQRKQK